MKSITLIGSGDHSGNGPENAMSLADAYFKTIFPGSSPVQGYCVCSQPEQAPTQSIEDRFSLSHLKDMV
jgi:hypothetical protein